MDAVPGQLPYDVLDVRMSPACLCFNNYYYELKILIAISSALRA